MQVGGAVTRQSLSLLHLFIFLLLLSGKFEALSCFCTLLACGVTRSDQSELLRVGNFRRLSAGTAGDLLNGIFLARVLACGSKGFTSPFC